MACSTTAAPSLQQQALERLAGWLASLRLGRRAPRRALRATRPCRAPRSSARSRPTAASSAFRPRRPVVAQLEPLVAGVDLDPPHQLRAAHACSRRSTRTPVRAALLELDRQALDERWPGRSRRRATTPPAVRGRVALGFRSHALKATPPPTPVRGRAPGARRAAARPLVRAHRRLVAARSRRRSRDLVDRPQPDADAGEVGRAERGRLGDLRHDDRHPEHVGLELHQPPVGASRRRRRAARSAAAAPAPPSRGRRRRVWYAIASSVARARCARVAAARQPDDRPARVRDPSAASRARSAPGRSTRRRCRQATPPAPLSRRPAR